jgi:hypothetical protein
MISQRVLDAACLPHAETHKVGTIQYRDFADIPFFRPMPPRRPNIAVVPLAIPVLRPVPPRRPHFNSGTLVAIPVILPMPPRRPVAGAVAPATFDLDIDLAGRAGQPRVTLHFPLDPPANANVRPIRKPYGQHVECLNRRGYNLQEQLNDWDPETYHGLQVRCPRLRLYPFSTDAVTIQQFIINRIIHYTNTRALHRRRTISHQPAPAIKTVLREVRVDLKFPVSLSFNPPYIITGTSWVSNLK